LSVNVSGTNGLDRGAGGANQLMGWNDNVLARLDLETAYEIALTGATFAIPEPTAFLLTGSALVWLFWTPPAVAGQMRQRGLQRVGSCSIG
jgi:hypothetical protein